MPGVRGEDLLPASVWHQHRDPLAGLGGGVPGRGPDHTGRIHSRRERQGELHLVLAPRLEQVGEGDSRGDDVDDDSVAGIRLRHLVPPNTGGPAEVHDLVGEHRVLPASVLRAVE